MKESFEKIKTDCETEFAKYLAIELGKANTEEEIKIVSKTTPYSEMAEDLFRIVVNTPGIIFRE